MSLPIGLTRAIETGTCVLFAGAGCGAHARDSKGNPAPDGARLAVDLATHFEVDLTGDPDLATIARIVELRKGRTELETFLSARLDGLEPDEMLQWLYSLPWRAIFTTNYDSVIERAFELNSQPARNPVVMSSSAEVVAFDPRYDVPIYHLHGSLVVPGMPRVLVTDEDYARFYERRRMLFEILKYQLATSPILYVGYSHRDPNWKTVDAELRAEFAPSSPPPSYRVVPQTDALQKELLAAQGIEAIDLSVSAFAAELQGALADFELDAGSLEKIAEDIPPDLHASFTKSPAAVARLLRGWTYVNQAPFHEQPNVQDFLAGNLPNWALVGADVPFERDIEESVFDALLDFATSQEERPRTLIVLGSAGYGVSTVLMRLAARLVKEGAGRVYSHRPGLPVNEGDVLYAVQDSIEPVFFIVDNAADEADRMASVIQSLRNVGVSACFLLGERLNEWRQRRARISPGEFGLVPLSDGEIGRLLEYLERNNALGRLTDLDEPLRVAAIKEKHEKQLLVAMREATEGRAFDAIIEDEFRGIDGDFGRRVYAAVCAFYRLRTLMRDTVLASVIDCPIAELYSELGDSIQGVVYFELIDEATGAYAARARHQTIAEIVWERAVEAGEREHLVLRALEALNLNYHVDVQAFDSLIRSDRTVDGLWTLDGKIRFFESAAQKDPSSPYVRQHYARMLLREEKPELALAEIEHALALDSTNRVIHHTKGVILREIALNAESLEIGRRRLVQSEEEFRQNINRDDRDHYSYQSLAELYVGWSGRAPTDDEALTYIAKAEEVIEEGLKHVRHREGLFIVSAAIQRALGDRPGSLEALRRAVAATPGSVVARYLLGRELRKAGEPKEAADVLHSILEGHPEEVGPAIQYALALDDLRRPYADSIAALRLASLYGVRDPRFISVLGGMLFLNGDFTAAEQVFRESDTQNFDFDERATVHYRPRSREDGGSLRLDGQVVTARPGYAFIGASGYPDAFCPGSRFGSLVMQKGLRVSFQLAFTPRGAMALDPQPSSAT